MALASAIRRHSCCFTAAQLAEKHVDRAMAILTTQQTKSEPDEDEGNKNQNREKKQQQQKKKQQMAMAMMEESLQALDAALEVCPGHDRAMELKARTLLSLRRFTEVIAMLHDDVPSLQHLISTANPNPNPNSSIDNSLGHFEVASPASSVSSSNCSCILPSSGELLTASSSSSSSSSSASSASSSASSDHSHHHHRRSSSRDEKGKILPDYKKSLVNISEPGSELESESGYDEEEDSNMAGMKKHDTCFSLWSLLSSSRIDKKELKKEQTMNLKKKKTKKKKKKKMEQQWRYLVLGQACWYLGMLEDAMALLQRSKRRASAVSRWQSNCMREDNFCSDQLCKSYYILGRASLSPSPSPSPSSSSWFFPALQRSRASCSEQHTIATEAELVTQILGSIKFLLRRRTAAMAALEAGLYTESARHFSKIIDQGRARGTPQAFVADCYLHRAIAYQATGRVVDAIADCNRSLALIPHCTKALSVRASLYEMVRCFSECLLDLQQLKMIYEASLRRQRMNSNAEDCRSSSSSSSAAAFSSAFFSASGSGSSGSGSAMAFHHASESYGDLSGGLDYANSKISATRQRLSGASRQLDAHAILELPLNCSREDVERAYLLISLKHRAEKAAHFIDKCESMDDDRDMESVREEATASATRLTQLIHKAYLKLLSAIAEEEEEEEAESKKASYRRRSYGRMMAMDWRGSAGGRSSAMAAAVLSRSRSRSRSEEDEEEQEQEQEQEDECDFCEPFTADVAGALLSEPPGGDTSPALSTWTADWTSLGHPHHLLLLQA